MGGFHIERELAEFGTHLRQWRMILGVTAQQVAERGNISRETVRKIEQGSPHVTWGNVAQMLRGLGILSSVVEATDPLKTDIGVLRADRLNKRRAR